MTDIFTIFSMAAIAFVAVSLVLVANTIRKSWSRSATNKAIEHGLRLCMYLRYATALKKEIWHWGWFHEWVSERLDASGIVECDDGEMIMVTAQFIRFPDTPALPKHAPPEVE